MASVAISSPQFHANVADLYGDRAPQPSPALDAPAPLLAHPLFAAQVAQVAAHAHTALPQAGERLDRPVEIVLSGGVQMQANGTARVQSQTFPDTLYMVSDACSCQDARFAAPDGRCMHLLASWIYRRVATAIQAMPPGAAYDREAVAPCETATDTDGVPCYAVQTPCPGHETAPVVPLPEAAASVNVRIVVHGREVQWTLRGTQEAEVAERLEALLARYPLIAPQAKAAAPVAEVAATPTCPAHHISRESTKAPGTFFCPSRTEADDAFCTWRHPAKAGRTRRAA
jgi:hypothetical protein